MLINKCTTIKKSMKKTLENLHVRPSITCDVWSDKSMKHAISWNSTIQSAKQELDKATGKTLPVPSTTRWASYILVIERFLEVHENVAAVPENKGWFSPNAKDIEGEYVKEKFATISGCYSYLKAVKRRIEKSKANLRTREMAATLELLLKKRFTWMVEVDAIDFDPTYVMDASLDPNTVHQLNKEELDLAINAIQPFVTWQPELTEENFINNLQISELDLLLGEITEEQHKRRLEEEGTHSGAKSWIGSILGRGTAARASFDTPIDPLKYWSNMLGTEYKPVAILALEVLSVPATSALIERVISLAGLATRNQRNRKNIDLLNAQLIGYCNELVETI